MWQENSWSIQTISTFGPLYQRFTCVYVWGILPWNIVFKWLRIVTCNEETVQCVIYWLPFMNLTLDFTRIVSQRTARVESAIYLIERYFHLGDLTKLSTFLPWFTYKPCVLWSLFQTHWMQVIPHVIPIWKRANFEIFHCNFYWHIQDSCSIVALAITGMIFHPEKVSRIQI